MDENQKPLEAVTQSPNGQPFVSTPLSNNQIGQTPVKKPSKWRYFFIGLGILQLFGVGLFFLIMFSIVGKTGSEFVALYLFITLVPAIGIIALINLIGLPIYMTKHKPHGKGLVFANMSLVISVILALYGAYNIYQVVVVAPKHWRELSEQSRRESEQKHQQFLADKEKQEKTKTEAITLMQNCKVDQFIGQTGASIVIKDANTKAWLKNAEQSSTGIAILENSPDTYVFASKLVTAELENTARQFRQSCYDKKKLYIKIDDWIETEYPAGTWTKVKQ